MDSFTTIRKPSEIPDDFFLQENTYEIFDLNFAALYGDDENYFDEVATCSSIPFIWYIHVGGSVDKKMPLTFGIRQIDPKMRFWI